MPDAAAGQEVPSKGKVHGPKKISKKDPSMMAVTFKLEGRTFSACSHPAKRWDIALIDANED